MKRAIAETPEFRRIRALPRRNVDAKALARELTELLKTPEGEQELYPHQAVALVEAVEHQGGVFLIRCGGGKTPVSLLLAEVFDVSPERTVLIVPAALAERDLSHVTKHWRVRMPHVVPAEHLGPASGDAILPRLKPRLIVLDEAHMFRNATAGRTRKLARYLAAHEECVLVVLSGTLDAEGIASYQHLARWALREHSPLPAEYNEAERWQTALLPPGKVDPIARLGLGALGTFGKTPTEAAAGYNAWIRDTPGVVATQETECDATLEIGMWRPKLPDVLRNAIREVNETRCRPDGVELVDGEYSVVQAQLACGLYLRWKYPAPIEWLYARREWWRFVRDHLADFDDEIDTEAQVAAAYPERYAAWTSIRDTFKPEHEVVWLSEEILHAAVAWAGDDGMVWSRWRAIGQKLEELGLPHYGQHARDRQGVHVEKARGPISCSISSCSTGAELQHYRRSLVLTPPASVLRFEQMLSRTHRRGQRADSVRWDFARTIRYHGSVLHRARTEAQRLTAEGNPQRLAMATWV